jgi:hypothetical protein
MRTTIVSETEHGSVSTITLAAHPSIEVPRGASVEIGGELYLVARSGRATLTVLPYASWRGRLFRVRLWVEARLTMLRHVPAAIREWWERGAPLRPAAAREREDRLVDEELRAAGAHWDDVR